MTVEEAVRRIRDCRDDHVCPKEEACFVLMKFAERKLKLDEIESDKEYSENGEVVAE